MTVVRGVRWFAVAVLVVVLVASATYMLVYLYRWEWNRAQISGIFFLSALVVLSLMSLTARMKRLENRIEQSGPVRSGAAPPSWIDDPDQAGNGEPENAASGAAGLVRRANDRHAGRHFEWLRRPPDRFGVFVPILIGAGAIVALVAFLIERAAGLLMGPGVDRRIADMLAPELPLGRPRPLDEVARDGDDRRQARPGAVAASAVLAAVVIAGFVLVLRDSTQNRAEPGLAAGETTIELVIAQKGEAQPAEEIAEALWIACRERLPDEVGVEVREDEASVAEATMWVDQGMGPLRRRRFFGCLEDATLDRASATIRSFRVDRPG